MVTIRVQVNGGVSPVPIKVFIDNIDNQNDILFRSALSFQQNYDLPPGRYTVTVSGINPESETAETLINLSGNFSRGPLPNDHRKMTNRFYSEIFYIEIS